MIPRALQRPLIVAAYVAAALVAAAWLLSWLPPGIWPQ